MTGNQGWRFLNESAHSAAVWRGNTWLGVVEFERESYGWVAWVRAPSLRRMKRRFVTREGAAAAVAKYATKQVAA